MAGDGILSIGATVDKTGVDAGLGSIKDGVQSTVQSIAVQVEETCAKTKAAWNKLSADVKTASQSVSVESVKLAETTKKLAAAQADLRRASTLSRDANIDEAESTRVLAAAQQRVTAVAAEVAEAKRIEADAVAAAAAEETLSENAIIAAFQRAAIATRESLGSMQAQLVETAETATATSGGIAAAMASLSGLFGAGLIAGFAIHFADETAKVNVELGHLATMTGMSAASLSGLREIVMGMGVDWEPVTTGLIRFNRAMVQAGFGLKQYSRAFDEIGLKLEDLKNKTPEEKLQLVAEAFARTQKVSEKADAALTLFGRGGAVLIPLLEEQGSKLLANVDAMKQYTGVTEESVAESQRWEQNMAAVSREFHKWGNLIIENAHYVQAALVAVGETIASAWLYLRASIEAVALTVIKLGMTLDDLKSGRLYALKQDMADLKDSLTVPFKEATEAAVRHFQTVANLWHGAKGDSGPTFAGAGDGAPQPTSRAARGAGAKTAAATVVGSGAAAASPETASPDISGAENSTISGLQAEARTQQQAAKQEQEAARAAAEAKIRASQDAYAEVERTTEAQVRLGQMSQQQRLAALRSAADEELKIREQQSQLIQMLDMADQRRTERDLADEEQAYRQHSLQIAQIQQQQAQLMQQKSQAMVQAMTGPFDQFVDHWLTNGRFMANAFANMADGMAMNVIRSIMRMGQAQLEHAVTSLAVHTTTNQAKVASDAVAAAQSTAIETESAMKSLAKSAAKAAGKAWSALSDIPVVGPVLGAAAAAATFTGVMALAAFDQGGVVPNRMGLAGYGAHVPILAEAGERVLSGPQSANFEKLVNQTAAPASTNVHYHDHTTLSGIDGASIAGMYRKNAAAGRREFVRQIRLANLT